MDVKGNSTQHDNLLYFWLFLKSSVTSDYNELNVSVTHVLRMIFYLSCLCVLWPPWLLGAGKVAHCALPACVVDVFECGSKESLSSFHTELLLKRIRFVPFWEHAGQSPGCLSVLHMLTVWFPPNQFISLHWNAKQHIWNHLKVFFYIYFRLVIGEECPQQHNSYMSTS